MREDWVEVELGNIFHTTSGGTPSRRNNDYYKGSIPWVKSGELDKGVVFDTEEKISEEAIKNSSAKIFPKGTLLIALYGATIGKLAFLGVDAATNQAICGIYHNDNIDSKFLYYFLLFRRPKLISQGTGGAQPNISQTILKKLEFPFPSRPEQRSIVLKIENLFASLDKGIADLKTAHEQLKVYRQAVLKKAFEGEFTNRDVKEGELPECWKWVKLGEVFYTSSGGTPSRRNDNYYRGTIPWVKSGELDKGKILDTEENISEDAIKNSSAKVFPKGTLLIAMYGATIGKLSFLGVDAATNQAICGIYENENIVSNFLYYFLLFRKPKLISQGSGGAQPNISQTILKKLEIPFPPKQEQHAVVREIESRLSVCDKVEQNINEALEKADALRQSILKKAFEGKLLSEEEIAKCKQEADYEPASELLKKIKAEKK